MSVDYRWSPYEGEPPDICGNKKAIERNVRERHAKASDLYPILNNNNDQYKLSFLEAYGGKCAYCGVSLQIIQKESFEIDHYIPKTDPMFRSKKDAGYMHNLVLSCQKCNSNKRDYRIPDSYLELLHPDLAAIKGVLFRDDKYYIRISDTYSDDSEIQKYYETMQLMSEVKRLDFLLMSLYGLAEKHKNDPDIYGALLSAAHKLRGKRNLGVLQV